jgi:hypothetical protein
MTSLGSRYGTALQAASANGKIDIVRLLLENRADPNLHGEPPAFSTRYFMLKWQTQVASMEMRFEPPPDEVTRKLLLCFVNMGLWSSRLGLNTRLAASTRIRIRILTWGVCD